MKMNNPYILSDKRQTEMINNGWILKLSEFRETDGDLFERLSKRYNKVKIYYTTTSIRGYYNTIAMVK